MPDKILENIMSAIEYIEAHLTEKLDLDSIAAASHYSKYYLHRTFTGTVGLTLHEYVQRRRLTEAAKLLVFSDKPILDIALMAGYESQQAFTSIFTAMYKLSPNKYREQEKFYPLQLKFSLKEGSVMPTGTVDREEVFFAKKEDIPCWMELVRLVIDGFPHLYEDEYIEELNKRIENRQALMIKDGETAAGIMLFSYETGSIDFMGTHPLYRNKGIPRALLDKAMDELLEDKEISITTYREGDKADTGHRKAVKELGFSEAELLVEFGYPTQRFILPREGFDDGQA